MLDNTLRYGRFTSSNIWKLTTQTAKKDGFGAPALTYINEKRAERTLGRGIDTGFYNQATAWGKVMEVVAYESDDFGTEYTFCSDVTVKHPTIDCWAGSPDAKTKKFAAEMKSYYPMNFFNFSKDLFIGDLETVKKNHKEEYWQVVSNAIILGLKQAELIAFMPTEKQLIEVRRQIEQTNFIEEKLQDEPWKYRFISEKPLVELPYVPEGIEYPNCVKFRFDIPVEDQIFLTKCVLDAEKLLVA